MLKKVSNHFHQNRNLDRNRMDNSPELTYKVSNLSISDKTNKHKSNDFKKQKDKTFSKQKSILERIFSHKSNERKSKVQKELVTAKAIAQSTIDIFAQTPQVQNDITLTKDFLPTSISTGNLIQEEIIQVVQLPKTSNLNVKCPEIQSRYTSLSFNDSLNTSRQQQNCFQFPIIPQISHEPPSTRNSPLLKQYSVADSCTHLALPMNDRSRKSSDNDSAVDLKFADDSSDQDRTTTSETGSSRCPSTSLFLSEDLPEIHTDSAKLSVPHTILKMKRTDSASSWRKLKAALIWTPFIQQCARHRYPWIQIAGHPGNFKPGEQGTILKKYTGRESICLQMMNEDVLSDFVPKFKCDIDYEGEKYICMQDLLAEFHQPSLIDIKMGTRTYLEEELVKAQNCPKPRQDMYEKMIEIDENEPTVEEHKQKGILKPRYMQWRETLSSTINLGFRIEGVKKTGLKNNKVAGTQSRDYKRTKDRNDVKQILSDFIDKQLDIVKLFITRLMNLKKALNESIFFWDHEFIGSSLLLVHDKKGNANTWMIDFGKTVPLPPNCKIDHFSSWSVGNHEDGYLFGLDHLLNIFLEIHSEIQLKTN